MATSTKENNLTLLILIFCFAGIYIAEGKAALKEDNLIFSPLSEGRNYTLKRRTGGWFLGLYETLAESLVLSLKSLPPYDAIKEEIRDLYGKTHPTTGELTRKTIAENFPVSILSCLSFISAFAVPLTGIIFGCYRCQGRCGGVFIEENMIWTPQRHRRGFTTAIALCSVLIMIGGFSIAIFNDQTESVVPALDSTFTGAIDGVTVYKDNTLRELDEVVGENMDFAIGLITQEITNLPFAITKPLMEGGVGTVNSLLEAIRDVGAAVVDLQVSLKAVADVVETLKVNGKTLRDGLTEARKSLTDAKTQCTADPPSKAAGACDKIPSGDTLQADADFNKVADAKQQLSNIEGIIARNNFAAESDQAQNQFNLLPAKINAQTLPGRQEITSFTDELQDLTEKMMASLRKSSDALQNDVLDPMKVEVHGIFGRRGTLDRYSGYRWLALLFISLAVVFICLLTFMALVTGSAGTSSEDEPATRSDAADCAGRVLMCVVGLYFFSAFFLDLILAVAFFLGANATVLCEAAADLSLLENTIDDPSTLGYYPISKVVLGNGHIEIKLSDILRRCNQSETPWEILQLDSIFKFEDMKSYKDKIPPMNEVLSQVNGTITSTELVSEAARKGVKDIFNSGVQEIDFFKYSTEAGKPLLKDNLVLTTFATGVTAAADAQVTTSPAGVAIAAKLRTTVTALNNLQNTVKISQPLATELTTKSQKLMTDNMNTMNKANKIDLLRGQFKSFLDTDGLRLANEAGEKSLGRALGWMDQYLEDTVNKLRNKVGDCQPIRNMYDTVVSNVCANAVGLVNAFWVSLGVIELFSVITIILCVRLAKHLRRAQTAEEFASEQYTDQGTSNYGVPLRLFNKVPKINTERFAFWKKKSPSSDAESGRWN